MDLSKRPTVLRISTMLTLERPHLKPRAPATVFTSEIPRLCFVDVICAQAKTEKSKNIEKKHLNAHLSFSTAIWNQQSNSPVP